MLLRLLFPAVVLGSLSGLVLIGYGLFRSSPVRTFVVEKISVGVCALLALAAAVSFVVTSVRRARSEPSAFYQVPPAPVIALLLCILLLAGPAILWRTRWRIVAEGVATVAMSAGALLTGFSIGAVFVPLLAAMIWMSFLHVNEGVRGARRSG